MKTFTLKVKDLDVLVHKKKIKNFHLNILPPEGKIRVSVPEDVSEEVIKLFIIKKFHKIKKYRRSFQEQERQTERKYVSGESHYFKGKRYILILNYSKLPKIEVKHEEIHFHIPKNYSFSKKKSYYEKWLRKELKKELESLLPKWEKTIGVKVKELRIKKMRTKWGSCNPNDKRIWINLELIKKPKKHLEYVLVHELLHLIERKHNENFIFLMNKYFPKWKLYKRQLNEFIL